MSEVEIRLKQKLSPEDLELASLLLSAPPTRVRSLIEEKVEEVVSG